MRLYLDTLDRDRLDLTTQEVLELGVWYAVNRKHDKARVVFEALHRTEPDNVQAACNLGTVLSHLGQHERGVIILNRVLDLDPGNWSAHANLGKLRSDQNRFDWARFHLTRATELNPTIAETWFNLAAHYQYTLQFERAIHYMQKTVAINPEHANAHAAIGMLRMLLGEYSETTLAEFEWKEKASGIPWIDPLPRRTLTPQTDTLLLLWEQGVGDLIQFSRYARAFREALPQLKCVVLHCLPPLAGLMCTCPEIDAVVTDNPGEWKYSKNVFQVPVLSSMYTMLKLGQPTIVPEPTTFNVQTARIPQAKNGLPRIGVCWRGNKEHGNDRFRSIPFEVFKQLQDVDADWYSLQYGMSQEEYAAWPVMPLDMSDWVTTAAHVRALDLVITCDTAIAHLAGSLGVNTWVLLSAYCDWRHGLNSSRSIWYPTVRLIRQTTLNDWTSVIGQLVSELEEAKPKCEPSQ